jgi:hypothetical protein
MNKKGAYGALFIYCLMNKDYTQHGDTESTENTEEEQGRRKDAGLKIAIGD